MTFANIKLNYQNGTMTRDEALIKVMSINGGKWYDAVSTVRKWGA